LPSCLGNQIIVPFGARVRAKPLSGEGRPDCQMIVAAKNRLKVKVLKYFFRLLERSCQYNRAPQQSFASKGDGPRSAKWITTGAAAVGAHRARHL
jgi:hypothetical protein